MLPAKVAALLACPTCQQSLTLNQIRLVCPSGHSFDVAKQGYVTLANGSSAHTGDTAAMLDSRSQFQLAGHYAPIAAALDRAVAATTNATKLRIVDLGAGTGYYLDALLATRPDALGIAIDASKFAGRRLGRLNERIGAVVADAWSRLPLADAAATQVLSVFAPRNAAEVARVLEPRGSLIAVTPTSRHLHEVIGPLGMLTVPEDKQSRLDEVLAPWFERESAAAIGFAMELDQRALTSLVLMGPSAFHADLEAMREAIGALGRQTVTASVRVTSYRKR